MQLTGQVVAKEGQYLNDSSSKRDTYFKNFILVVVIIIGAAWFWPLFIEEVRSELVAILVLTLLFLIMTGFILWTASFG